jgi:PIN domain nuclease of toxin-antitoxin system
MNRVLLDTCAFIWLLREDTTLGEDALAIIEDTGIRKLLSPVSYWEVASKSTLPKYRGKEILGKADYKTVVADVIAEYDIEVLHFSLDHTGHLYDMEYFIEHKDPFDRILVAKALVEQASLISSDGKLYYYGFEEQFKNVWVMT